MPRITTAHEHAQREKILRAANNCFGRRGYHQTTIQDICDEAELSKGGLYTYFRSKEDILGAVVENSVRTTLSEAKAAAASGRSALHRLDRVAEVTIARLISGNSHAASPQLLLEIWAEASKNPEIKAQCSRAYDEWRAFLTGLLRDGIARGEIKAWVDPDSLAAILLAVFDGLSLQEGITAAKVRWPEIATMLRRGLVEGIIAGETSG
ncbi:MAG TPA: TetR/AcrR family transcriptional regulator [bacterium]|jgi:AcrR family transcriptional regulator